MHEKISSIGTSSISNKTRSPSTPYGLASQGSQLITLGGMADNIGGEVGSIKPYPTFIPPGPKKLFCLFCIYIREKSLTSVNT